MKLTKKALLVLTGSAILFASQANGQTPKISPEWKAHFTNTPVIENCVFECKLLSGIEGGGKGQTNLYQFRFQKNAFLFREIRNLDDVSLDHIVPTTEYEGRFGSNCWAIKWNGYPNGALELFPNADNIWEKWESSSSSCDGPLVYFGERMLFSALYFGINTLDPSTMEWQDESNFTALNMDGGKLIGRIIEVDQGRPTVLEWRGEKTVPLVPLRLEYKYDTNFDLAYFPSEFELYVMSGKQKKLAAIYTILTLKTAATPLEEKFFDPYRYFAGPASSIFTCSNKASYYTSGGHLEKVRPYSEFVALQKEYENKKHPIMARVKRNWPYLVGVIALSVMWFFFTRKRLRGN